MCVCVCVDVCGGGRGHPFPYLSLSHKTIKSEILPHPTLPQWPAVTATDIQEQIHVCVFLNMTPYPIYTSYCVLACARILRH